MGKKRINVMLCQACSLHFVTREGHTFCKVATAELDAKVSLLKSADFIVAVETAAYRKCPECTQEHDRQLNPSGGDRPRVQLQHEPGRAERAYEG